MVSENIIPIENKKVQIVEIREIENYQGNWFTRNFLSKTYCCKNSLCGCYCYSEKCTCSNYGMQFGKFGPRFTAHGRKWEEEIDPSEIDNTRDLAMKVLGTKDAGVGGKIGGSLFRISDSSGDAQYLGGSLEGKIGKDGIMGRANADLANFKTDGGYL